MSAARRVDPLKDAVITCLADLIFSGRALSIPKEGGGLRRNPLTRRAENGAETSGGATRPALSTRVIAPLVN